MDTLTAEPVTREDILAALRYMVETRLVLRAADAPADCLARMDRRIDHLLDFVGATNA